MWSNFGCYLVLGVTQHSLHGPMCGLLAGFLDLSVRCRLGQTTCQVHHWHISHWHPERHACQLTKERGRTKETCRTLCHLPFLFFLNLLATIRKYAAEYQADDKYVCPYPLSSGMTLPTALAAPVEAGMMFWWAPRPSRQALALGPSTVFWVAVYAWTVVYRERCRITGNINNSGIHLRLKIQYHVWKSPSSG